LRLRSLDGRSADRIVSEDGKAVDFWRVGSSGFWSGPKMARRIERWQIHQKQDRSLQVRVVRHDGVSRTCVEQPIREHIEALVGSLPIKVTSVPEVHNPIRGKFRAITSECAL
jgi:hypothetical protein